MNKKYILRKNEAIQYVIRNKDERKTSESFVIYCKENNLNINRYCISISKKIGKANVRNLFKRKIKNILMKNNLNNACDYVIILKNPILEKKYFDIEKEILNILKGEKK